MLFRCQEYYKQLACIIKVLAFSHNGYFALLYRDKHSY